MTTIAPPTQDLYLVVFAAAPAMFRPVLAAAGVAPSQLLYTYRNVLPGFAARLSPVQARRLRRAPGVIRVAHDERVVRPCAAPTGGGVAAVGDALGLTGAGGVWQRRFGGPDGAGLGVVIGFVDTGIWPEHPSFAPLPEPRPDAALIAAKWKGGADSADVPVNNKLIGARSFKRATRLRTTDEFDSPRDRHGHGTQVASIAAGNASAVSPADGGPEPAPGIAPAARIAVYKALWDTADGGAAGATADVVAAIDAAVADGVDILNFAMGGVAYSTADLVQVALFNAAKAGVVVIGAAGDSPVSGPGAVGYPAPWVISVGSGPVEAAADGRHDAVAADGRDDAAAAEEPAAAEPDRDASARPVAEHAAAAGTPTTTTRPVLDPSTRPRIAELGDLLKPDLVAPAAGIVAATTPHGGEWWTTVSGSSMATAYVAGMAALVRCAHPTWPPMWVKSALLSSAVPAGPSPLDSGSGLLGRDAFAPGLVYDSTAEHWVQYMAAVGDLAEDVLDGLRTVAAVDLNHPSITVGAMGGTQVVTRNVTNVTNRLGVYSARVEAPPGTTATVHPSRLVVLPGRSATFRLALTRTTAPLGRYTFGSLTWSGRDGVVVRSPVVVRPVALRAPVTAVGRSGSGAVTLAVRPGYTGTLTARVTGAAAASVERFTLSNPTSEGFDPSRPAESDHVWRGQLQVPPGTRLLQLSTVEKDVLPGINVDVFLFRIGADGQRELVADRCRYDSEESIWLADPAPGEYECWADLNSVPTGITEAPIALHVWLVPDGDAAVRAVPERLPVTAGVPAEIGVAWSGLPAGRHLARLGYGDGAAELGVTTIRIDV
jgi:hypothetical protein